nr:sensor histidine kinase [Azospirillum oleiclasticum]
MQEVNHRIKNSLQMVSSLLALQGQSAPEGEARRQIAEAGRRVRAVSDIHTLLYRGQDVRAVPFHDYLAALCRDLERSAMQGEEWRLELALEPAEVPTDRAVPLGLIANELVMNAVKHAYPDSGDKPVRVGLARVDAEVVRLTVADRGTGLPEGFDWRRSRSLGMRVVHALSAQLGAGLEVRDTAPGTEFAVTVRLSAWEEEQSAAVSAPP